MKSKIFLYVLMFAGILFLERPAAVYADYIILNNYSSRYDLVSKPISNESPVINSTTKTVTWIGPSKSFTCNDPASGFGPEARSVTKTNISNQKSGYSLSTGLWGNVSDVTTTYTYDRDRDDFSNTITKGSRIYAGNTFPINSSESSPIDKEAKIDYPNSQSPSVEFGNSGNNSYVDEDNMSHVYSKKTQLAMSYDTNSPKTVYIPIAVNKLLFNYGYNFFGVGPVLETGDKVPCTNITVGGNRAIQNGTLCMAKVAVTGRGGVMSGGYTADITPSVVDMNSVVPTKTKDVTASAINSKPVEKIGYYTASYGPTPLPVIITVNRLGPISATSDMIFNFIDGLMPNSKRIRYGLAVGPGLGTFAQKVTELDTAIREQLLIGNKVLVVGHSMGSFVAFNTQKRYADNKNVKFLYVDPPYASIFVTASKCLSWAGGIFGAVNEATCTHIEGDSNTVNWTNGKGFGFGFRNLNFHTAFEHPFDRGVAPNGMSNAQNLEALRTRIRELLISFSDDCSYPTIPPPLTLGPVPLITGIVSSSGAVPKSISPGETVSITGMNFGKAYNVLISNTQNSAIMYNFFDIAPDVNGLLNFVLPDGPDMLDANGEIPTTPGIYSVRVSAIDSGWSTSVPIFITHSSPATRVQTKSFLANTIGVMTVYKLQKMVESLFGGVFSF